MNISRPTYEVVHAGVFLGQNCVEFLNVALNDLFFSKNIFFQKHCKYAMNIGVAQIRVARL